MEQIRKYPEDERYTMNKLSPVTLGKAFQSDTVEQLGHWMSLKQISRQLIS
jgi:hypothetical protein